MQRGSTAFRVSDATVLRRRAARGTFVGGSGDAPASIERETTLSDSQDRRKRTVKGSQGGKRATYLDWAQEDRDSEGIHLVLGACNGSKRYLCGQRSPTTSLAMCTYYRPVFLRLPKYLREISSIYEIVRFYVRFTRARLTPRFDDKSSRRR